MYPAYPNHLVRGITRSECVNGDEIYRCVFDFDKEIGKTGKREQSIQWMDNADAEYEIKNRKKMNGELQFSIGFASIETKILDDLCKEKTYEGLRYTRAKSKDNPFHGLILLNDLEKLKRREVSAELAMISNFHSYNDPLPHD